jgi:putative flippase GtrA
MSLLGRGGHEAGSRPRRPAVVETVGSPQSTSDGRTILATLDAALPRGLRSQIARFAAIGVISTLAWAGLYTLLRGAGLGSVAANGVALVVTAIGNTAANRRLTFGVTGRDGLARDHGAGLVAFGFAIAITTIAASALARLAPGASRLVELVMLTAANVGATAVRFVVLRTAIGHASPLRPI